MNHKRCVGYKVQHRMSESTSWFVRLCLESVLNSNSVVFNLFCTATHYSNPL